MSTQPYTVESLLAHAILTLQKHGFDATSAQQEARWIIAHARETDVATLLAHKNTTVDNRTVNTVQNMLHARTIKHKPLGYILGHVPFCELTIQVAPPTLIPRMETEEWVTGLIQKLASHNAPLRILDLCTGSGCIALALAHHLPHATVIGVDIAPEAVRLAQQNATILGITNVSFQESDLFPGGTFDLIVSNPPYLSSDEWDELAPSVKVWESDVALVARNNGLALYEQIISSARTHLSNALPAPLPQLVFEIGYRQKKSVVTLLCDHRFTILSCQKDTFGNDRCINARS